MKKIESIWIHCSATPWGDIITFDQWHRARGWNGVGYHFVIMNGRPSSSIDYWKFLDGEIQPGRPLDDDPIFEDHEIGAHVAGRNRNSIGICLVGDMEFTDWQLMRVKYLCKYLCSHFELEFDKVFGHYEDPNTMKTCPNIPMNKFREHLQDRISGRDLQTEIHCHNLRKEMIE